MGDKMNYMNNLCVIEDKCWMFDDNTKSIYSVNFDTGKLELEVMLNLYESCNHNCYFSDMVYHDGKVILIPGREESIYFFDTTSRNVEKIRIKPNCQKKYTSIYAFITGIIVDHYLYLIPYTYPDCIKLNLDNMSLEYIPFENYFDCTIGLYNRAVKINESEIMLLSREHNGIAIYDTNRNLFNLFHVGDPSCRYEDVCFNGDNCYLADDKGNIILWNRITGDISKVFGFNENNIQTIGKRAPVNERTICFYDNYVWVFDYDYLPVKINSETDEWEIINDLIFDKCDSGRYYFVYSKLKENFIVLYAKCIEAIILYYCGKNDKKCIPINLTEDLDNDILRAYIKLVCES